ncbi:MAG: type II toxin-antitoxin system MqsA family antitoxin [Roseburia sp.]|nr:type II toxin-antitoxin system MqsA family antitoxin [Roseburia sp.]
MMCAFCKGKETENVLGKYLVALDDTVLIVNNVPSIECVQCGEKFYTDDVSEVLEEITDKARTIHAEILMVDYDASDAIEIVR